MSPSCHSVFKEIAIDEHTALMQTQTQNHFVHLFPQGSSRAQHILLCRFVGVYLGGSRGLNLNLSSNVTAITKSAYYPLKNSRLTGIWNTPFMHLSVVALTTVRNRLWPTLIESSAAAQVLTTPYHPGISFLSARKRSNNWLIISSKQLPDRSVFRQRTLPNCESVHTQIKYEQLFGS